MTPKQKRLLIRASIAVVVVAVAGALAWQMLKPQGYGDAIASGNGRIEATEIDVATKLAGRVTEILVKEGDFVEPGQVVARMDTQSLEAERRQTEAELQRSRNALQTARAGVAQNESNQAAAEATVHQREAELNAARKRFERSNALLERNVISHQQVDDDRAAMQSAQAALAASRAQVSAAQASVAAARSQVIEAQSAIAAAQASVERVQSDIEDSLLRSDRLARVQYRVVEPGEVLAAGGKVLNLVDLTDVYMTFFLPTSQAGRVALGDEVHLILDAAPGYVLPARVSFVSSVAQFTPKTVETENEREKLMFRIRARIAPQLLHEHIQQVKTGLPGEAYLKLDPDAEWPDELRVNVAS
ncbi:HlyD family secretion protein [Salinicola peritrichatus]|jgi:HlyD family secretion protein|uniref:HlyD family secretion protein n=1 Tax=Salinicola peritrichatus TaxID=1267424 RepID=UPI000DA150F9|nr:HlyD family efflux transporter periplasmic adaptor subunit [Salinicola peritrichatus]